jgi:hypothetical protein
MVLKVSFLPKTKLGRWSVVLIIAMFGAFIIGRLFYLKVYPSILSGRTIVEDILLRPGLVLSMLSGFLMGIVAFITGISSFLKKKEKSVLVLAAIIISGLLILMLVGEIISSH